MTDWPQPRGRLAEIFQVIEREFAEPGVDALMNHILGGTSTNWLAETLSKDELGLQISPTTLKAERKRMRRQHEKNGGATL